VDNVVDADGKVVGARLKSDGSAVDYEGVGTMSKSKNNGVDPQELIDRYGADTARLFVMFASPPEQTLEWSGAGVEGAHRFLRRLWSYGFAESPSLAAPAQPPDASRLSPAHKALRREIHTVLRQANYDYQRLQYNTVVSAAMKMLNALEDARLGGSPGESALLQESMGILLRTLYPIAPHIGHALWNDLGYAGRFGAEIIDAPWPQADEAALVMDEIELVVQVNGKLRASIRVPATADRGAIEQAAIGDANVQKFVAGQSVKRVIVVPGKLVNVVV
jgi:leucyl-tRNA synthetase